MRTPLWIVLLCASAALAACGSDDPRGNGETDVGVSPDAADVSPDIPEDVDPADVDEDGTPDVVVDTGPVNPEDFICEECEVNEDCGPAGNLCLNFPDGGTYCGWDCTGNDGVCPAGTVCAEVTETVSQCVPATFLCEDPCLGVECPDEQVCDITTGECIEARGLCEECDNNTQCGTAADLCLTFPDADNFQGCAQDCAFDPNSCPEGYFCANVGDSPEGPVQQCVPEILTCVDRCEGVTCETEGDFCNPRTGECSTPGGVCDPCVLSQECGGEEDRCLGLPGPPCEDDTDCGFGENCGAAGVCVASFCGIDCSLDASVCEEGHACFNVGDGAQCLPLRLSCTDRCAGVECAEGENCDDQTGECVESEVGACGTPCDSHAECGGYDDLCLSIIPGGGQQCYYRCGDERAPCPIGYACFNQVIAGQSFCIPNASALECGDCTETSCPEGEECRPPFGECHADPAECAFDDRDCADGTVCNIGEERCEPVGLDCTFEDGFFECGIGTMSCTAAAAGLAGECEENCGGACPDDRSACLGYHGVIGRVCASDTEGGAHTCGRLMQTTNPIGRPCTADGDPRDPALCFGVTDYCLEDAATDIPGFCTTECSDGECPVGSTCEAVGDGQYCVPEPCGCMAPIDLDEGVVDVFGALLADAGASRCSLAWELRERRMAYEVVEVDDAYRLPSAGPILGEPLQVTERFDAEIAAAVEGELSSVNSLLSALYGTPLGEFDPPDVRTGDAPLFDALSRFETRFGEPTPSPSEAEAMALVPLEVQEAAALLVDALREGVVAARATLEDIPAEQRDAIVADLFTAATHDADRFSLTDPDLRALVADEAVVRGFFNAAGEILAALDEMPREFDADLSGIDMTYESSAGLVRIVGDGDDVHDDDAPYLLLIELGGDDRYTGPTGVNAGLDFPVSLVIDLGGADTYTYEVDGHPEDEFAYPSDGAGRAEPVRLGNGPVTFSSVARQGAGLLGVGILADFGLGHDTFESLRFSQGFGLMGVGLLVDEGDTASFRVEAYGQGAGLFGAGALVAGDAAHRYQGMHALQGYGGVHGVGAVIERGGDDVYEAVPGSAADGTVLYFNPLSTNDFNFSAAQGAGVGLASERSADGRSASGGFGVLVDVSGADEYTAGVGAQGFAHWHGVGVHHDLGGDDVYEGRALIGGAASQFGVGFHSDTEGDDDYGSADVRPALSFGYGSDFGGGVFADFAGADEYFTGQFSLGFGRLNGIALFADHDGDDAYDSISNDSLGRAVLTIFGSEPADNPRRSVGTYGFFVDAGGFDSYERPDLLSPVIGDGLQWLQTSPDEDDLPTFGGGVDEIGATGLEP